jgi:hypothetical protein
MFNFVVSTVECRRAYRCAAIGREWQKRQKSERNSVKPKGVEKFLHEKIEPVVQVRKRNVLNNDVVAQNRRGKPIAGRDSKKSRRGGLLYADCVGKLPR